MSKHSLPMGVSQWKNHGKKYGYWDYFREGLDKGIRLEIKAKCSKCGHDNFFAIGEVEFKIPIKKHGGELSISKS